MAIRRTDIDIIIPSATYQQKNDIPVWDAYIEKVVIDGDIPSIISDRLCGGINSMINGYPQKFYEEPLDRFFILCGEWG